MSRQSNQSKQHASTSEELEQGFSSQLDTRVIEELSDEELELVAGGGLSAEGERLIEMHHPEGHMALPPAAKGGIHWKSVAGGAGVSVVSTYLLTSSGSGSASSSTTTSGGGSTTTSGGGSTTTSGS
jgi:hypothetical protein